MLGRDGVVNSSGPASVYMLHVTKGSDPNFDKQEDFSQS